MALNGVLVESMIQANNIDALNRSAKAEFDVAGGGLVALAHPTEKGDDVWTATKPAADTDDIWMAYNPEVKYVDVNGKRYAGLSLSWDLRDYTNLSGLTFDVFKPQIGDEIVITKDCVVDFTAAAVDGYLVPTAGDTKFTAGTAKGSVMAFQIEWVGKVEFPSGKIGTEYYDACKAVRVQ